MYADDIVLMSTSLHDLQLMINLCFSELNKIDMIVNIKKTMCMRIGSRFNVHCASPILGGIRLTWVSQIRYLGVFIDSGNTFKIDLSVAKRKFFVSCNSIFSKVAPYRADIVLPLIMSYCVPSLTYGIESVHLNKTELTRLEHPYTMVFHKIFGTYSKNIILSCQYFTGFLPLRHLYNLKKLCFFISLKELSIHNELCKYLYDNCIHDQFAAIAIEYGVLETDSKPSIKHKIWTLFNLECV